MIQRICLKNIPLYMVSMVEPLFEKYSLSLCHSFLFFFTFFILLYPSPFTFLLLYISFLVFYFSLTFFFFSVQSSFLLQYFLLSSLSNILCLFTFILSFFLVCLFASLLFVLFPFLLSFSFLLTISSFLFPGCP